MQVAGKLPSSDFHAVQSTTSMLLLGDLGDVLEKHFENCPPRKILKAIKLRLFSFSTANCSLDQQLICHNFWTNIYSLA